jgi:ribosomal protein S6
MEKGQKIYEVGYLLNPLVPEEKLDEEISVLRGLIEKKQGLITGEERAKMQRLAFVIKKPRAGNFESAWFGWMKFMSDSEILGEIKDLFDKNQNIVRFLILESLKEDVARRAPRKTIRRKPLTAPAIKTEIKTEEVDKKLEELLAHEA